LDESHPISCREHSPAAARDQLIALTLLATPLLMPFYFDYDLLLLAVPATLYAANRIGKPNDVLATSLWVVLALLLFVNPYVATATRANVATVLLGALTVRTAWGRWRTDIASGPSVLDRATPALRAAA
jgi:hypothetical protein